MSHPLTTLLLFVFPFTLLSECEFIVITPWDSLVYPDLLEDILELSYIKYNI